MKNYKKIERTKTELELESVVCDRCNKEMSENDYQWCGVPYFGLSYVGGYNSEYPGDMMQLECDLCEKCLEDLVGEFATITKARIFTGI